MRRTAFLALLMLLAVTRTSALAQAPQGEIETVEADVSTRAVGITSGFTGVEIIVFGAVHSRRRTTTDPAGYDVVVTLEGAGAPVVMRRKSRVAGLWANTQSMRFDRLPSYFAIASTRPVAEIAEQATLDRLEIGFRGAAMKPRGREGRYSEQEFADYREAVIRLKQRENLYVRSDYGVSFIGRSLFRTTIALPSNIPVGPLRVRVVLFRDGAVLSQYAAQVRLEFEGIERVIHWFAFRHPIFYGAFAVTLAAVAGLGAAMMFRRRA